MEIWIDLTSVAIVIIIGKRLPFNKNSEELPHQIHFPSNYQSISYIPNYKKIKSGGNGSN